MNKEDKKMINFIEIKLKIGELINQYKNNNDVETAAELKINDQYVNITFLKGENSKNILIDVRTEEYIYKFIYPAKEKSFDMSKLDNIASYPIAQDD